MNELKLKYNITIIKWSLFCFFLLGNFLLLARNDDKIFIIIWEISVNSLAIGSFITLSFLPRLYYVFDDKGMSYQNYRGREYIFIPWDKVVEISYIYILGFIPDGLEIKWRDNSAIRNMTLSLSVKQVRTVYKVNEFIRGIIDNSEK